MRGRIQHQLQPARLAPPEAHAYCAGLIDGDGCISIVRQLKRDARRGYIFRLSLDITQNHLGTLLDFQNLLQLPGRVYQVNRDPPRQNSCRLHRTRTPGAAMKDRSGSIRTNIQRQSGGAVVAAGERGGGSRGA